MNHQAGGWLYEMEDLDALKAGQIEPAMMSTADSILFARPKKLDPRPFSPMENQSSQGACQGFAITAAGGLCYYGKTGEWKRFSADAAYYLTQQIDGIRGDSGSTITGGMKMATNIGFLPEEAMPYTAAYDPQRIPRDYKEIAAPFRVKNYKVLSSYAEVVEWIGRGYGGVSWGIRWAVSLDSNGFMQWGGGGGGGHANAILGYDGQEDSDGLPEYLIDKNSWGDWGPLHGWCLVRRSTFEKILRDQYTVVVGISDMEDVKPRVIDWVKDSVFS